METGRKSLKFSQFNMRYFKAFSELSCEICFLCISGVWLCSSSTLTRSHIHLQLSSVLKLRESTQEI